VACSGAPDGSAGSAGSRLTVVAEDLRFSPTTLTADADATFTVELDNRDRGIPHNIAIYRDATTADPIVVGDVSIGEVRTTHRVDALPAGSYFFRCDVHRLDMTGVLEVR
jgi:plastocyanin